MRVEIDGDVLVAILRENCQELIAIDLGLRNCFGEWGDRSLGQQLTILQGKGDTTTYDRMVYVPIANNQAEYHTYGINWTSAAITWTLDGAPVRTLKYADAKGGTRFPQTPARLKIGIWAAPTNQPGIVEWAGGLVDLAKGPYAMTVSDVNIVNYSPGKEYRYKDRTGNWDSIEVIDGSAGGIVAPGQEVTPSATGKTIPISTASTMVPMNPIPTNVDTKTGGSLPPTPAFTSVAKPGNSSTLASISASATNVTASGSKSTASPSASKPAGASGATSFGATSAAVAGLSLLFLAFLA